MRHVVVAALAAVLLSALGGCAGDEAPEASPATAASSSSATAGSAPALPAAAEGTSPKAAEAFVRHYVDVLNYATSTLDSAPLKELSTPDCEACQYFVEAVATTKQRSGRYEGGSWKIAQLQPYPRTADGDFNVRAQLNIESGRVIQKQPQDVASFAPQQTAYNFILVESPGGLAVKRIAGVTQ